MKIRQDPVTGLWCREDGAILMPPTKYSRFKKFRWTFGCKKNDGYRVVRYRGKLHQVHRLVCRAFHGLPPEDKPEVDHSDRCPSNNAAFNLHWTDSKCNNSNKDRVDHALEKYGVRACEDRDAYGKAYMKTYSAEKKDQGLSYRKGPDGRYHWLPRIRP